MGGKMEHIYLGMKVVLPLLLFMSIGILVRKLKWVSEKAFTDLNRIVFRVFMPISLFLNASAVDMKEVFSEENVKVLSYALIALVIVYLASELICARLFKDKKRQVVVIQAVYRSNLVLFGLPICNAIYGEGGAGVVSIFIITIVPLYNIVGALLLARGMEQKQSFGSVLLKVIMNPLVIGAVLGILYNLTGGIIPKIIMSPLKQLGNIATPLAFIVLGGSLVLNRMKEEGKIIAAICGVRLCLIPALVLAGAVILGTKGVTLVALVAIFATPTSVSSYTMAKEAGVDSDLAGDVVAVSTVLSLVTVCFFISLAGYMNLL